MSALSLSGTGKAALGQPVTIHANRGGVDWSVHRIGTDPDPGTLVSEGAAAVLTADEPGVWIVRASETDKDGSHADHVVEVWVPKVSIAGPDAIYAGDRSSCRAINVRAPDDHSILWEVVDAAGQEGDDATPVGDREHWVDEKGVLHLRPTAQVDEARRWTVTATITVPSATTGDHQLVDDSTATHQVQIVPRSARRPPPIQESELEALAKANTALTATADKWEAGVAGAVALFATVSIVTGPSSLDKLSGWAALVALTAAALAFMAAGAALVRAASVSRPIPDAELGRSREHERSRRMTFQTRGAEQLRVARRHTILASLTIAAGTLAVAVLSTVTTPEPPETVAALVTDESGLRCIVVDGGDAIPLTGRVQPPVVVEACPSPDDLGDQEDGDTDGEGDDGSSDAPPHPRATSIAVTLAALVGAAILALAIRPVWWWATLPLSVVVVVPLAVVGQIELLTYVTAGLIGFGAVAAAETGTDNLREVTRRTRP